MTEKPNIEIGDIIRVDGHGLEFQVVEIKKEAGVLGVIKKDAPKEEWTDRFFVKIERVHKVNK